ncbi:hypothetical protein Mgra_00003486 [Meloidogyne graminicola]|uniref:Uncharacterized protein n=1 Tax=Meloidogyne graminicola TaxID=189291 RepID=A0A8S9ZVC3_9BILA|nr:hypothetical protein Mgra_00003486 [Meloidogyne graminicola]
MLMQLINYIVIQKIVRTIPTFVVVGLLKVYVIVALLDNQIVICFKIAEIHATFAIVHHMVFKMKNKKYN